MRTLTRPIVWKSLLHHQELLDHPNFTGVRDELSACFSAEPSVSHIYYDTESTALDQPVLHVLRAETRASSEEGRQYLGDGVKELINRLDRRGFGGQTLESPDVYYVLIGAATVEVS